MATTFYTFVELMSGVPLDPRYNHTLTFNSLTEQRNYFTTKVTHSSNDFSFLSYQRYNRGVIKVEAPINLMGTVNYLRFTNSNFSGEGQLHENKNIYAFITDIQYISDRVVAITYQVDVFQTWMFNYTINPCYVEREHANSDNLGDNLVPEGLETGEYIVQYSEAIDRWTRSNAFYVVSATQKPDGTLGATIIADAPTVMSVTYCADDAALLTLINQYIAGATANVDPIINVTMGPKWEGASGSYTSRYYKYFSLQYDQTVGVGPFKAPAPITSGENYKTYTPKNKKLLTYPYNFMVFESPDGSSIELRFENFRDLSRHITFAGYVSCFPNVETMMVPTGYELTYGEPEARDAMFSIPGAFNKGLSCNAYPTIGVASDAFRAWWAQNKYSMPIIDAVSNFVYGPTGSTVNDVSKPEKVYSPALFDQIAQKRASMPIFSAMPSDQLSASLQVSGQVAGAALSMSPAAIANIAEDIGKQLASYYGHKAVPNTVATKANNTGVVHSLNADCYKIYYTRIRPEYAEIIDNYFTCYGYATRKVKQPNVFGRRSWNYVQTKGATIEGDIPFDATETICNTLDRGITFWHNPATIHNYNADNSIV